MVGANANSTTRVSNEKLPLWRRQNGGRTRATGIRGQHKLSQQQNNAEFSNASVIQAYSRASARVTGARRICNLPGYVIIGHVKLR